MSHINRTPVYNLKAVLQETSLTADVLRAWERRYQLPEPHRTPGGHRLYSEYDIQTVLWLKARQAEGLRISRAVQLWRELIAQGRDPLVEMHSAQTDSSPDPLTATHAPIESMRQDWLTACMAFNEQRADEILTQGFAMFPVETVCIEIMQCGLNSIGSDWYLDKVTVQQEHFASELAVRRLETLIASTPPPTRSQIVLIGCPEGEWHTFPTLLLSLLLRRRGLGVVYLGANVAIERLEETTAAIKPDLIVLAAQMLTTAASLHRAVMALQKLAFPIAYGGLAFNRNPALKELFPAHFLGESLDGSVWQIEQILLTPAPHPAEQKVKQADQKLAQLYRQKRPLVEMRLQEMLRLAGLRVEFLAEANAFFGDGLAAALELGNPALLEPDIAWVQRLLTRRQIPSGQLFQYMNCYQQALQNEIGSAAAPITDWIAAYGNTNNGALPQPGRSRTGNADS